MKYLYEVDGDELIELKTTTQDGYLAYRTDRLTSYIASDRPLKNAVSSSSSSSSSSSTTSGGSTSSKPNPDTGRINYSVIYRRSEFGTDVPNVVQVSLKGLCQDLRHKFRMIQVGLPFGSPAFLFSHGMANFYGMKMITKW